MSAGSRSAPQGSAGDYPTVATMTNDAIEQRDPVLGRDGYIGQ